MEPTHFTLEADEFCADAVAVTLYFPAEVTDKDVLDWVHANPTGDLALWYDLQDSHFEAVRTKVQPTEGLRVQCHPTC